LLIKDKANSPESEDLFCNCVYELKHSFKISPDYVFLNAGPGVEGLIQPANFNEDKHVSPCGGHGTTYDFVIRNQTLNFAIPN